MTAAASQHGQVQTILGLVEPQQLGVTLPHEHLLCNLENWFMAPPDERSGTVDHPFSLDYLGAIRRRPFEHRANLVLRDVDLAIAEARRFRDAGGGTIVDVTLEGIGKDFEQLATISKATGLHIVGGCGFYVADTHPPRLAAMSEEQIAELIISDLRPPDGRLPAGVIGEIGTSAPIEKSEWKVLGAAAIAQRETGAPISIHALPPGRSGLEALTFLCDRGVPATAVSICHLDLEIDLDYHREILRTGAYAEYDVFGYPGTGDDELDIGRPPPPCDPERIRALATLVSEGYQKQLLLSHDICLNMQLVAYGGFGYGHIVSNLPPLFALYGIDDATLSQMLKENPQRWLTWKA